MPAIDCMSYRSTLARHSAAGQRRLSLTVNLLMLLGRKHFGRSSTRRVTTQTHCQVDMFAHEWVGNIKSIVRSRLTRASLTMAAAAQAGELLGDRACQLQISLICLWIQQTEVDVCTLGEVRVERDVMDGAAAGLEVFVD